MSSAYDQFQRTTRTLTRKPSASGRKSGSRLNSEGIDSLASPLTHPCPSGFAIYVARLPSAPFASTAFNIRTGWDQRLEKPRRPYLRLFVDSFATHLTGRIVSRLR